MFRAHSVLSILLIIALGVPFPRACQCADQGACCGANCQCALADSSYGLSSSNEPACCCGATCSKSQSCCESTATGLQKKTCSEGSCKCGCGIPDAPELLQVQRKLEQTNSDVEVSAWIIPAAFVPAGDDKTQCLKTKAIPPIIKRPNLRLAELCRWLI